MIISYKWLCQYLPEALPVNDLGQILTSIGLEVEAIETVEAVKGSLKGLVIGKVETCEKHPNADKLSVTKVNVGGNELLPIVCGAPNVAAGQKVVVATVGTTVHPTEGEPFLIKKAKIRGEESEGMICAEDEIGLGKSHAGIMILPEDATIGMLAQTYFNIGEADYAIHIGLTPNRSDAMSHLGVAKDICAYLSHHNNKDYKVVNPDYELAINLQNNPINIKIHNTEACPRYAGISIKNVTISPSPEWLQQYLKTIEVRSINNVVDITNYVLHEMGQPLHAFDADKISGNEINVQFVANETPFICLDEKEKKLTVTDLMICDNATPLCIAGVFGGAKSAVNETTKNIFLESAYFDATHVRRTSTHHGLRTDAATHFEKGVDINLVIPALKRAAKLIVEIAGGTIDSNIADIYPSEVAPKKVNISFEYINKLSGKDFSPSTVKRILLALGFDIQSETDTHLMLIVPTNKADVSQPADIVEEILRIDGLDNIDIPNRLDISLLPIKITDRVKKEIIANHLCGLGFQEIVTNSIVNSKYYPERTDLVRMINSLSSELDVMRPTLLESGLEVIQYNVNRKETDLMLYEFGNTYLQVNDKYIETPYLSFWITGNKNSTQWNQKATSFDVYYVKGIIENLAAKSGIKQLKTSISEQGIVYTFKKQTVATITNVDQKKLKQFDLKQEVIYAEINWQLWYDLMMNNNIKYKEVNKYPVVQRDLAIVIDKTIEFQQVKQITEQLNIQALKDFGLFDIFEHEKIGADKKSFALNFTFQLDDRTLTDNEIETMMQALMKAYKEKLEAQIRS